MSTFVDHLVFATPDLNDGVEEIERLLGVPAVAGGSHPGLGTRNALFGLGSQCYLEVIGPDPAQTDFAGARPFGIDQLTGSQLVSWVARRENLSQFVKMTGDKGVTFGELIPLSRRTQENELLQWELCFLADLDPGLASILPFFIDWGQTPSPALQCANGAELVALELEHPQPSTVLSILTDLELDVAVTQGAQPRIRALIRGARGEVELRTPQ